MTCKWHRNSRIKKTLTRSVLLLSKPLLTLGLNLTVQENPRHCFYSSLQYLKNQYETWQHSPQNWFFPSLIQPTSSGGWSGSSIYLFIFFQPPSGHIQYGGNTSLKHSTQILVKRWRSYLCFRSGVVSIQYIISEVLGVSISKLRTILNNQHIITHQNPLLNSQSLKYTKTIHCLDTYLFLM